MSKKPSAKKSVWLKNLKSEDADIVVKTIQEVAKNGDLTMVLPLLECMRDNSSEQVRASVASLLADVKHEGLGAHLFEALNDNSFSDLRAPILSIIWNADVNLNGHLESLIKVGSEGGFEEQFEVITALDNFSGEFDEAEVLNSLIEMREVIRAKGEASELQQQILQKLQVLERFD